MILFRLTKKGLKTKFALYKSLEAQARRQENASNRR